jgi:diadenosine tetraphosphate (Ap4A) HIT family hydrolase
MCDIILRVPEGEAIVYRNEIYVAAMDRYPIRPGHAIIFPTTHEENWLAISQEVYSEIMSFSLQLMAAIESYTGQRAGMFFAGKAYPEHAHMHVLPIGEGLKRTFANLGTAERIEADINARRSICIGIRGFLEGRS